MWKWKSDRWKQYVIIKWESESVLTSPLSNVYARVLVSGMVGETGDF